jgi:hypothetical protein
MRRIALFNLVLGFSLIFMAASGGAFVALRSTETFLQGVDPTWQLMLQTSSHGHTNLFGVLHILLGLTIPYSRSNQFLDRIKTFGLGAGSFAMGPLLIARAASGPSVSLDGLGLTIGACLSLALAAIVAHIIGLFSRLIER